MSAGWSESQLLDWLIAEPLAERVAALRSHAGRSMQALHATRQSASETARAQRWRAQFPFGDGDLFAQRLAASRISNEEFLRVLDDEEAASLYAARPPAWLRTLVDVYSRPGLSESHVSEGSSSSADALFAFLRSAEPIIDHFVSRLRDEAIEITREDKSAPYDAQAVQRLFVGGLLETFKRMLAPTMILQLNLARLEHQLAGETPSERFQSFVRSLGNRTFAARILKDYPVLARQLVLKGEQWLANSLMFLRDLSHDWPTIRAVFTPDVEPGRLVGIQAQLGDSHRGGRSVLTASFRSGLRLVYKPRSLAVDLHFQEILNWLNHRTGNLTFRTLKVLDCGTHGWMEFVHQESCESTDGIQRFYERQGGYLALVHLLNGSDFHCENVIASGEHPVLVDLEALFHARIPTCIPGLHGIAAECWETSVLRTGLLPIPMRLGEEAQPLDRSGLGAPISQMTPFAVSCPEGIGTDEMQLVRKRMAIKPSAHWPSVGGQPVEQLDADAIVRGFRKVYQTFLTHRDDLLDAHGPVARFRNDEVRVVLRHTLTYARLLAESFHPDVLRNALDRDQLFDLLWGRVPDSPHLRSVVDAECRDLWNGDVPLFIGHVGSRDIVSSTGQCIPDFLPEPTDKPVHRRIQGLNEADLERQTWLTRASLATLSSGRTSMTRHVAGSVEPRGTQSTYARLIAQACRVGDRLEVLALRSDVEAGWIGLKHDGKDEWSVRPVGPDLYEGTAGIVLFLAYIAAVTREGRYQRLAHAGAANLRNQASGLRNVPYGIGAFSGWGGLIYVYSHLAVLWDRPELLDEARGMVDALLPLIDQDNLYDVVGGAAGCIGSLLAMYELAPSDNLVLAAIRCGDRLVRSTRHTKPGVGWPSALYDVPLAGFSHGASGIARALLALYRLSGETRFRETAMAALEYERSLFDTEKGHWADLRPRDRVRPTHAPMAAWCHGAAGIGLSRLNMLSDLDADMVHREIAQAVDATLASGFGDNHSLCHGDLGNLDFLLQASEALNNDAWRGGVHRLTARILDDVEQNGWKCGIGKPLDTPGLMTGLAGIGYGMLRLAAPQTVPSVITLSPPVGDLPHAVDALSAAV